jgi:hypothetical protein
MKTVTLLIGAACLFAGNAFAKLPDASPEAKAKAEVTKAENAHKDKVAAFQLCKSQNAVATRHLSAKGKKAAPPACEDPGKFVPPPVTVAAAPAAPAAAPAPVAAAAPKK